MYGASGCGRIQGSHMFRTLGSPTCSVLMAREENDTMSPCARPVAGFLGWLHAVMLFDGAIPGCVANKLLGLRLEQDRQSSRLTASAICMSNEAWHTPDLRTPYLESPSMCSDTPQTVGEGSAAWRTTAYQCTFFGFLYFGI